MHYRGAHNRVLVSLGRVGGRIESPFSSYAQIFPGRWTIGCALAFLARTRCHHLSYDCLFRPPHFLSLLDPSSPAPARTSKCNRSTPLCPSVSLDLSGVFPFILPLRDLIATFKMAQRVHWRTVKGLDSASLTVFNILCVFLPGCSRQYPAPRSHDLSERRPFPEYNVWA